jgi:hypothetical protein
VGIEHERERALFDERETQLVAIEPFRFRDICRRDEGDDIP